MMRRLTTRLRTWWEARKLQRKWARLTPGQQMALMVDALNHSADLRRRFREALYGKTLEAVNPERRRERRAR